ncbi:hypothetical protein HYH02_005701 [Chlamydomonas schloesseri]|uniref:TIR domain-containing protein n=1 Tax=Chlamydomonas schloesseri TaxID=2026947 RepID=A0A836B6R7_9CHLO|nr:hypothetical protein HYH02_005701 [Chlamydomonas schloesseri]|eukprot:KAG2448944.1 hypothetical protein HYH02_005701 [Chlamydomonas schloesseri]
MCKDKTCQDSFHSYGAVRKLIRNVEVPTQHQHGVGGADLAAAVRAVGSLVGGPNPGPAQQAAAEDLFLSGTVNRLRNELLARKQFDDVVAAIGEFLSSLASSPLLHARLRDAGFLPLLPAWLNPSRRGASPRTQGAASQPQTGAGGGSRGGSGSVVAVVDSAGAGGDVSPRSCAVAAFLEVVLFLSMSDAVAPCLRTEPYFDALCQLAAGAGTGGGGGSAAALQRCALLALCNVFGSEAAADRGEVLEEVFRGAALPALLASLLAGCLGPGESGAAARHAASMSVAAPRRSGSGVNGSRGLGHATTMPRGGAIASGAASGDEGALGAGALASLSAPGLGAAAAAAMAAAAAEGASAAAGGAVPVEWVLHAVKCAAANPRVAKALCATGSASFALPRLLDVVVASHTACTHAGTLSRGAWVARAAPAAAALLRLASTGAGELVPVLRSAGAVPALKLLATTEGEAGGGTPDPRVSEPAKATLLYMSLAGAAGGGGGGGHALTLSLAGRLAVAAFQAVHGARHGGAAAVAAEPSLDGRFQVFVSHAHGDAAGHPFALYTLYPLLVLQGLPTFVDPVGRALSGDWVHMIVSCRNLVLVLSEGLLASSEHVKEAEAALAAGVNLLPVLPEGCRWPDAHGNRVYASPPPAVLDTLPERLRQLLADPKSASPVLPYTAARHADFATHLMARMRLPPPRPPTPQTVVPASAAPLAPQAPVAAAAAGGGGGGGGGHGGSEAANGDGLHTIQLGGNGTSERAPGERSGVGFALTPEELGPGTGAPAAEASQPDLAGSAGWGGRQSEDVPHRPSYASDLDGPSSALPWPWSRLLDPNGVDEPGGGPGGGPQRYPRQSLGVSVSGVNAAGDGVAGAGGSVSASCARVSSSNMVVGPPPGTASHASRRHTARLRSSLNRHAALQHQAAAQQMIVQQQWLQEYHQQAAWAQAAYTHAHPVHAWGLGAGPGAAGGAAAGGSGILLHGGPSGSLTMASGPLRAPRHSPTSMGVPEDGVYEGGLEHGGGGGGSTSLMTAALGSAGAVPMGVSVMSYGGGGIGGGARPSTASGGGPSFSLGMAPAASVTGGLPPGLEMVAATNPMMLNQLLALQMEMVRYELRQAVQASHETICHKIDRLRSDFTEQVVQLRFELGGKIETLQDAVMKATKAANAAASAASAAVSALNSEAVAPPVVPTAAAAAANGGGALGGSGPDGSAMTSSQSVAGAPAAASTQHQALAAALTASLQDAVNKAVAQLQASVLAAGGGGANLAQRPGGHKSSAAAMLAAAAQQQQAEAAAAAAAAHGGGRPTVIVGQLPHLPQGAELSPVVRAGAAAWSAEGSGGSSASGGATAVSAAATHAVKSRTGQQVGAVTSPPAQYPQHQQQQAVVLQPQPPQGAGGGGGGRVTSGRSGANQAYGGGGGGGRPNALAMFDSAVVEDDAEGAVTPSAMIAAANSPTTAQAAILMAQSRGRQAAAAGVRGGGGSGRSPGANTLPPLVERTEMQPVRKAQQQALLQQHHGGGGAHHG